MKEVIAIIRQNMINRTKDVLVEAGFPAFTAAKASGRGRRPVDFELLQAINEDPSESADVLPTLAQGGRLIPKRLLYVVVPDDKVTDLVNLIIKTNQTGSPGDGKIFVLPMDDVIRVRTGESGDKAVDEMKG
ncbi:P-II family nitrogen regulator [Desulfovulcanus ferrireducens]|jgi:nitrogen regulatory protein PII 2|uniref:P-II family nitrogen regulator n=1 Tax=Desulfovulcanus ferrireducens TaxID=2831190 RepID=UPI00207BCFE4|nr:P-II family nitrogen regulator [Desulfovulcanus ferrireducens]